MFEAVAPGKDVGVTGASFVAMSMGRPGFASCTPAGIMALLDAYEVPFAGQHAARRTRTTRNGQSILANRSQAEAIASCSASSFRCRGTDVAARSFQYGAEARSASVQQ